MVEIIEKHWTKQEILKRMNDLTNQKTMMKDLSIDTAEVDVLLKSWKDRHDKLQK